MRTLHFIIIGLLSITFLSSAQSCRTMNDQTVKEKSSKEKIKKSYDVAPFKAIEVNGVANVSFSQSDNVKVEVIGRENVLSSVVIESHKGVLRVNTRKIGNERSIKGVEIRISAPTLTRISNRGVGDFRTTSPLKTPCLTTENSGVGDVQFKNIECEQLTISHKGVGDMTLSGKAVTAKFTSSGVGDVNAKDLKAQDVDLRHTGVGDLTCYASDNIRIHSHGVGTVTYYGDPHVVNLSKKGVGSLKSK